MRRRDFIALAAGAAAAMPVAAHAQETAPKRRLAVLMNLPEGDAEGRRRIDALLKTLEGLGWNDGKNLDVIYRWGVSREAIGKNAAELVALTPDVIIANAPPSVEALQQLTHTLPIVFAAVTDPVPVHDLHATLLHALGLNHERLTYPHDGRPGSLTDVSITKAKLVPQLLA